jgi:ABC-type amino acid transport substrate-binding protein
MGLSLDENGIIDGLNPHHPAMTLLPSGLTPNRPASLRPQRRGLLLGGLLAVMNSPLLGYTATQTARVAVPGDVADDLARFLNGRDVALVQNFGGPFARRDVMELAYLLREMRHTLPELTVQIVRIDSYARLLIELASGRVDVLGTTAWKQDLLQAGASITLSPALLANGESTAGFYTTPTNHAALSMRTSQQLKQLKVVSNSAWTTDWTTLTQLGLSRLIDVKTWPQMVQMVANRRADLLLAPFATTSNLELVHEGMTLVPVQGVAVALGGSRHLASANTDVGRQIAGKLFPVLEAQVRNGDLRRAYTECGFYNPTTAKWPLINPVTR